MRLSQARRCPDTLEDHDNCLQGEYANPGERRG